MPEYVLIGEPILWRGLRAPQPTAHRQFAAVPVMIAGPARVARRGRPIDTALQPPRRHPPSFAASGRYDALAAPASPASDGQERHRRRRYAASAVTDRPTFGDVHLYSPIRIIEVFKKYSVLCSEGIASGVNSKPVAFGPDAVCTVSI